MSVQPSHPSHTGSSEAVEDYAKAIYSLQRKAGGEPVTTNGLAERKLLPRLRQLHAAVRHVIDEPLLSEALEHR